MERRHAGLDPAPLTRPQGHLLERLAMSELVQQITDDQFQSTIAQGVTLVDFWAPWCGPCKMIAPILDELAGELQGKAKIVKINVDDNPVVAGQFGIMSIPTLLLFKDGKKVDQKVGGQPKPQLKAFIQQAL
jgi:thioredoxin 1